MAALVEGISTSRVEGQFEWVLDYSDFAYIFDPKYTRLPSDPSNQIALVVGCGTSDLSLRLAAHYGLVVSVDNDESVIEHMANRYKDAHAMKWITHDMIECFRVPISSDPYLQSHMYDIVIDKCSMDAMLVEGSVAEYFCEVHRLLKVGGVFVLCSLHPPNLIYPFLSLPSLEFVIEYHKEIRKNESGECFGTIALCRKVKDGVIDYSSAMIEEKQLMDSHYQQLDPWLTTEREILIRQLCASVHLMSLRDAHALINRIDSSLGYDFDLFLSDINNYSLSYEGNITLEELISFLKEMQ